MHQKVLSMILVLVMLLGLLSVSAFTVKDTTSSDSAASNDDSFYRIVHLDCGRKYFTKDWIIALLNEMKADGYNQLQLAFGNDGLRFLLDNMSFEANGIMYSHSDVVSKVKAGNQAQNDSGDERCLTQSQMDDIISAAKALGIEIVPLLNLPGHANAILDIADDTYNASGSNNTLDVANREAARNFGMAIFQKYVDYFASRGCKFFSFGADEYANDVYSANDPNFSFNQLNDNQYSQFVGFVNRLATYISNKENVDGVKMTPRAFNDGLYFSNKSSSVEVNTDIQCCYWSSGWGYYQVASADTISQNRHAMINTHGDYYYVLGKQDNFDGGYSYASGFNNTAFMSGPIQKNPVGSMFCIWCDYPNAEEEQTVAQKVRLPMRAMALRMQNKSIDNMDESAVPNGFNTDGSLNTGSTVTPDTSTSTKDIYVAVNGTATRTVSGTYSGQYTPDDTSIATVTANATTTPKKLKAVTSIESGKQYLLVNVNSGKALTDTANGSFLKLDGAKAVTNTADLWTITSAAAGANSYTVMSTSGKYLSVGNASASASKNNKNVTCILTYDSTHACWDIADSSGSSHLNRYGGIGSTNAGGYGVGSASDPGSRWEIYEITGGDQTTLTFNGIAEGTTSVQIGGVTYTIHVTAEDLNNVTPLTIEYWITNSKMPDANGNTTVSISATKDGVASESGVSVADIVSPTGNKDSRQQEFWQSKLLDKNKENDSTSGKEEQTTENGDDETLSGFAFTKVRYWGGAWQVYTTDWVTVKNTDQLVAYYMEIVKITNKNGAENLHVNAADWGTKGDGKGDWGYTPESNRCSVSVQLVYEDGSTSPSATTAAKLNSKTIVYGYWDGGRGLGTMVFNGKDNYQIFKVTAETGDMSSSTSGNTVTVNSFAWDNNEETVWEGAATDSVSIGNPARKPSYDAPYDNLAWNTSAHNKNNAILIRVYVKSIPKAGALTVNYFVQGNADPFYHYGINVVEDTIFDARFARVADVNAPGKAKLVHNSVTNYDGEQQEVQSDLSKMTEIGAQYRYSDYTFDNATRSEDGKTVNLYYTFKAEKTFVVDFGLPLVIRPVDVQSGFEGVTFTQVDVTQKSTYANITVDGSGNITYTLNQPIDGEDTFGVKYHGYRGAGSGGDVTYTITVIPATSVYYEDSFDSFATFTNADKSNGVDRKPGNGYWTTDGTTKTDAKQALEALHGQKNVYGYDDAYANSSKFSMGSATKVTVDANTANNGQWPTAAFTFKGTGFDVISLTNSDAGTVVYTVTNKSTGKSESHFINNYYGYAYVNGQWVVTNKDTTAPYQVPVIKVSGLAYDTYEVKISVVYGAAFDENKDNQYSFWLDAIRVYDPAGDALNDEYAGDGENAPNYVEVKKVILDTGTLENKGAVGAVFIDGKGADGVTAADYKSQGPNHEAYLAQNQAIAFQLIANAKPSSVQIGAKLANGTSAKLSITGANCDKATNGSLTLNTATDMYYELTGLNWTQADGTYKSNVITLTNTSDDNDIVSLTNVKFIGAKYSNELPSAKDTEDEATVVTFAASAAMVDEAVSAVDGVLNPAPQVFAPSRFEASWGHAVRKGDAATLTVKASEDVDSITVDGQTITAYVTKTERTGWGWWAKTVTYREFTYQVAAEETTDYTICAVNSAGVSSDPITATLTVRPSVRDWWHGIFDKWF